MCAGMQGLLALPVSEAPFSCSCTRSHLTGGSPWASEGPRAGRAPDPERSERPHRRDEEERFHYQGCPRGKHAPDWGDGLAQHAVPAARPSWHERALISVFRQASFFFANKPAADISYSSQGRALLATKSSRDWRDLGEEQEYPSTPQRRQQRGENRHCGHICTTLASNSLRRQSQRRQRFVCPMMPCHGHHAAAGGAGLRVARASSPAGAGYGPLLPSLSLTGTAPGTQQVPYPAVLSAPTSRC